MANLKLFLLLSIIVTVMADSDKYIPIEPTHTSSANTTTTNSTRTTTIPSKSTTISSTTHDITNATTSKPITTTNTTLAPPHLNTTTTSTTLAPPLPNTTTTSTTLAPPHPNITTTSTTLKPPTPNPTPKPTPKPVPNPEAGNWSVNFKNSNNSCMVVDAAIQVEFLLGNTTEKINLPFNATGGGSCDNDTDVIDLKWENNGLTLDFDKQINGSKFELKSITAKFVNLSLSIGVRNYTLFHKTPEFGTPLGNSYKCAKIQTLNLTDEKSNATVAYLHLSHVQMQAFANTTEHKFNSAIDCESSPITSDVVPIVVGCVLAALVIMIMVAYLVARRRCQARGYLSM